MSPPPLPTLQDLTPATRSHYLNLYPTVLQRVYKATRPRLNQTEILADDKWRYEELPGMVDSGVGLAKEQLARLVKWKITHGTNRPFLPSMIAKNTPAEIKETTIKVSQLTADISRLINITGSSPPPATSSPKSKKAITSLIESALSEICKLKGVGPATGSLVLSVYVPRVVPFFGDEVFEWVVNGDGGSSKKLKYDRKEYLMFLTKVLDEVLGHGMRADELEKVGYVLGHLDVLGEEEREVKGEKGDQRTSGPEKVSEKGEEKHEDEEATENRDVVEEPVPKKVNKKRSRKQEVDETVHETHGTRRSKRIRK